MFFFFFFNQGQLTGIFYGNRLAEGIDASCELHSWLELPDGGLDGPAQSCWKSWNKQKGIWCDMGPLKMRHDTGTWRRWEFNLDLSHLPSIPATLVLKVRRVLLLFRGNNGSACSCSGCVCLSFMGHILSIPLPHTHTHMHSLMHSIPPYHHC